MKVKNFVFMIQWIVLLGISLIGSIAQTLSTYAGSPLLFFLFIEAIFIIPSFVIAGIVNLAHRLRKTKTDFVKNFFGNILLSLIFYPAVLAVFNAPLYGIPGIMLIIAVLIVHSILYKRCGFVFGKTIKKIIEFTFNVKIIAKDSQALSGEKKGAVRQTGDIPSDEKIDLSLSRLILRPLKAISRLFAKIVSFVRKNKKRLIPVSIVAGSVIAAAIAVVFFAAYLKANMYAIVVEKNPTGLTDNKATVKILYSNTIAFRNPDKPGEVFTIEPAVSGMAQITGRTLYFIPDGDLPSSTRFKVFVHGNLLTSDKKQFVSDTSFSFNTKLMGVENINTFYSIDEDTNKIESLVCEANFTLPVDKDSLADRISITLDGKSLPFTIERSEQPTLVYLTIRGFEPGETSRDISLTFKKGIKPISGSIGLENDFSKTVTLREKDRLAVEDLSTYHVPGSTFVVIKFNQPVNGKNLRSYITVSPAIDYSISDEYRYVILEAQFKVNVNYSIDINKGLISKNGLAMKDNYKSTVFIEDSKPYVKFSSPGMVLPLTNNLNIEFKTLNLDKVRITLEKVYKNNLINYLRSTGGGEEDNGGYNNTRKLIYNADIPIEGGTINEEVKNLINLKKLRNSKYEGLYYISLADTKEYYNYARMLVHVTDMGLIIKNDGKSLFVYAVNILTLAPLPGVKVSLVSLENQILQQANTDENGRAVFPDYNKTEENLTPYLVLAEDGEDFTYLPLKQNNLDYSSFDVEGSSYKDNALDCFAKTERGVYRPGEDVYATLVVRKTDLSNPDRVPIIVEANDPTGTKVFEKAVAIDETGMLTVTIPTQSSYKTGEYSIIVKQDEKRLIGSTTFKIEEFIPATIQSKVELISQDKGIVTVKVSARELHGAPSKGLKVTAEYRLASRTFTSKAFKDYRFFDDTKSEFNEVRTELGEDTLDENGEKIFTIEIPSSINPPSSLALLFYSDVYDTSGRPIGAMLELPIDKYSTYYGLNVDGAKPFNRDKAVNISFVALAPGDKTVKRTDVSLKIKRRLWYTIFKKYGWTEKYSSESFEELVLRKTISIDGTGSLSFVPDKGGEYTVTLSEKGGMTSTLSFFVYDKDTDSYADMTDPGKLTLSLDKQSYAPGDTAFLSIRSPLAGRCMVSIERDKTYNTFYVDCSNGKAVVPIHVSGDFIPNAYVSAMAFRKPSYDLESLPPVSYGAINIKMDRARLGQPVKIAIKDKIRAQDGLTIDCTLPGGAGSKVVIAAVDEGILMITNYKTGDPYDYFFRKRGLTVSTSTTLKDLLPDIAPYKKAFGGGADEWARRHLNPFDAKRVKSIALFSGVLTCDEQGKVHQTFKINEFNGKLRVMVMSAKDKRFGSAEGYVTVTDPIVLSPGIPRVLAPEDAVDIPLRVFNKTGKDGKISVRLETKGPLVVEGVSIYDFNIKDNDEGRFVFRIRAKKDAGIGTIAFYGNGNGEQSKSETELAIRPACPAETNAEAGSIPAGKTKKIEINTDYIEQGKYIRLAVSPHRIIKAMAALDWLFRYPYGCVEQLTSQTFPMLYLAEYAQFLPDFKGNKFLVDKYIDSGIKEIEERMLDDGSFTMWPGGSSGYPYFSDYASHFLLEAKRLGYPVSDKVYTRILNRLGMKEEEKGRLDRREQNLTATVPYHFFLKALAGKPDTDSMRSFYDAIKDPKRKNDIAETDRIFLGAAYGLSGDKTKAREVLPKNFEIKTVVRQCFGQFDSYVRNTALYLYALTLIDPSSPTIPKLSNDILARLVKNGGFGTTQETAWALLALNAASEVAENTSDIDVFVDGKFYKKLTEQSVLINELPGKKIELKNNGTAEAFYNLLTFGTPSQPSFAKEENGLTAERVYKNLDGTLLDTAHVKKGTQVVVTLSVKLNRKMKDKVENVVFIDLLPAGFEIENTRLASHDDAANTPENKISIESSDIRDDRIILFSKDFTGDERYSYIVRAVSAGEFVIPQFGCEAMYDPELSGKSKGGDKLIIVDEENTTP